VIELSAGSYLPTSRLTSGGEVTIAGPSSGPGVKLDGGAVEPSQASLLVVAAHAHVRLVNIEVTTGGGRGSSAALDDYGTVELASSTLAGNNGPGLLVEPRGSATVRNSTLSEGLDFGLVVFGNASLLNATIAGNAEGGIEDAGSVSVTNTIVANDGSHDCTRPVALSDHSLDGDGSCGVGALSHRDPLLGRLQANGGPTATQAPGAGSPAIGAGDASKCPSEDQRHAARPRGPCDLGAYQSAATASGSPPGPTGGEPGPSPPGDALVGVRGHGTLRGASGSRIAFSIRALAGQPRTSFAYSDRAHRVALRALRLTSLAIDGRRRLATVRGAALLERSRRRVGVTIVLVSRAHQHSLRVRLSNGYRAGGAVLRGSITFVRARR